MDFIGLLVLNRNIQLKVNYPHRILLYDTRIRRKESEELNQAEILGLVSEEIQFSKQFPSAILLDVVSNADETVFKVCKEYLSLKPRYLPMRSDNQCDQRRTSFRKWLAVKTSLLLCGNTAISPIDCQIISRGEPSPRNESVRDSVMVQLRRNFQKISRSVKIQKESAHAKRFPLPFVLRKSEFESSVQVWLAFMSRWLFIVRDLHPSLCNATGSTDHKRDYEALTSVLKKCEVCKDIIQAYEEKKSFDLFDNRESIFQTRKILSAADKSFVDSVVLFSATLSHSTIMYFVSLKTGNSEKQCFVKFMEMAQKSVQTAEDNASKLYKRKYRMKHTTDYSVVGIILETISHIVKCYSRRKFSMSSESGDKKELLEKTLYRVQKFLCNLMDEFVYQCVQFLHSRFKIRTRRALFIDTIKSLNLYVTWTSMNLLMEENQVGGSIFHWKPVPKTAEIRDAFRLAHTDIVHYALPIVYETTRDCEIYLFRTRWESSAITLLPLSVICEDFPNYLKSIPKLCRICPHPVVDLYEQSERRLEYFMKETLACFEKNRTTLEKTEEEARVQLMHGTGEDKEVNHTLLLL